jgi:hypothetical protein
MALICYMCYITYIINIIDIIIMSVILVQRKRRDTSLSLDNKKPWSLMIWAVKCEYSELLVSRNCNLLCVEPFITTLTKPTYLYICSVEVASMGVSMKTAAMWTFGIHDNFSFCWYNLIFLPLIAAHATVIFATIPSQIYIDCCGEARKTSNHYCAFFFANLF